jgi:hypothetical protein
VPFYLMRCPDCQRQFDVFEGIHDGKHDSAVCECGQLAQRMYTPPMVFVDQITEHFNHGLGMKVSSRRQIRDAQRAYKDRTGSELVEVGNERPRAEKQRLRYPTAAEIGIGA